jgi:hypothetical protein
MTASSDHARPCVHAWEDERPSAAIDPTVPNIARVYDYWLGGKDHYAVDREMADQVTRQAPDLPRTVRHNRAFLARVVRFLAAEAGIRQFLDIGTGLPTRSNVHEVAQAASDGDQVRTVYVDNDPVVLRHADALLATDASTIAVHGDLRKPGEILIKASRLLDLDRPFAVLLFAVLHFLPDEDDSSGIVRTLTDALPSGGYLALSHAERTEETERAARHYRPGNGRLVVRTRAEIGRFLDGLELVQPGLVHLEQWRPELDPVGFNVAPVLGVGGVGLKR